MAASLLHRFFTLGALVASLAVALPACESGGAGETEEEYSANEEGAELSGQLSVGTTVKTTANVNFRSGPSTSNKIVRVLNKGTSLTITKASSSGGFYQVEDANGTVGWVSGKYLVIVSAPKPDPDPGADPGADPGTTPSDPSAVCSGVDMNDFRPPTSCNGPSGYTSKQKPSNNLYSTSWFGCYRDSSGKLHTDPSDNCEFACGAKGYCATQGPECQAKLKWFAADADRFGCGTKIRVTNCANSKSVVLVTLDRGPNCKSIEQTHDAPVVDMSHDAMGYLFNNKFYGGGDHKGVVVEVVDPSTPLGPS